MKGMKPRLAFQVENKLKGDDSKIGVDLHFNSIEDFEPEQIARQVEPLRKLMEVRRELTGLLAKADGNEKLGDRLREIIGNTELLEKIAKETNNDEGEKKPQ
jgi:type VI secretion system protein ImpB